ncbi:helix-turn-helix domain-containing protein [Pluralibacter gergoviae]
MNADEGIYGFLIDDRVLYDLKNSILIQYGIKDVDYPFYFKVVSLNKVQSRLLYFLLAQKNKNFVSKDEIMENVWEDVGLSSSTQKLWQSINDVRRKLSLFNLSGEIITNLHGIGYKIGNVKISSLHMQ